MFTEVTVGEVALQVIYTSSKGRPATHWEPEEFPEIAIEEVRCNGVEVSELLSEKTYETIIEALGMTEDELDYLH